MQPLRSPLLRTGLLLLLSACTHDSAKMDHSPCAGCDFQPVNAVAAPSVATAALTTALTTARKE